MMLIEFLLILLKICGNYALPTMQEAPKQCPIEYGNLLDDVLFVESDKKCQQLCSTNEKCKFYYFYDGKIPTTKVNKGFPTGGIRPLIRPQISGLSAGPSQNIHSATHGHLHHGQPQKVLHERISFNVAQNIIESEPPHCFLYDDCNRFVHQATKDCPLSKENTVEIKGFVGSEEECKSHCADNFDCVYYHYVPAGDDKCPLFCYLLHKCTPRRIEEKNCPLTKENYIDHFLFVETVTDCRQKCQDHAECRYWKWFPIDYSPAPEYCYLFSGCVGADVEIEQTFGLVLGGRHPGHYFLAEEEEGVELVKKSTVCPSTPSNLTSVGRGGAVTEYVNDEIMLCGGRDTNNRGQVLNSCMVYEMASDEWKFHSHLTNFREESASVVIRNQMYIFGGNNSIIGNDTVLLSSSETYIGNEWISGPNLPEGRARFCAVALNEDEIAIIGGQYMHHHHHEVEGTDVEEYEILVSNTMSIYNLNTGRWIPQQSMKHNRMDHACAIVTINDVEGILVSGGVDEHDNTHDSVEFYNLRTREWTDMAPLKVARTEHGMGVIGGIVTVIGGVCKTEFLSSIEVLDHSFESKNSPFHYEWRISAHALVDPRYDFALAIAPVKAFQDEEQDLEHCKSASA